MNFLTRQREEPMGWNRVEEKYRSLILSNFALFPADTTRVLFREIIREEFPDWGAGRIDSAIDQCSGARDPRSWTLSFLFCVRNRLEGGSPLPDPR